MIKKRMAQMGERGILDTVAGYAMNGSPASLSGDILHLDIESICHVANTVKDDKFI